jgi:hypothetical protein
LIAAHASSPATAAALCEELSYSQPEILSRAVRSIPAMLPKAYRFAGEMEEIAAFVGEGEGDIYKGVSGLYRRMATADPDDLAILKSFTEGQKKPDLIT